MVNYFDMQKSPGKYGIDSDLLEEFKDCIDFITFGANARAEGVISEYNGMIVFPERGFESTFQENETWLCLLKRYETVIKVKPIEKLDSSFFFDLKAEQVDKIVDILWQKNKDLLEPALEKKFLNDKKEIKPEIIDKYEKEIQRLKIQISDFEQYTAADKQIIKSLQVELIDSLQKNNKAINVSGETIKSKSISETPSPPVFDEFTKASKYQFLQKIVIERIEPDTISSKSFVESRYFVHISKDKKLLLVRPHTYGDVICTYNKIDLIGLGVMAPFDIPKELNAEYSHTYGGILINL